MELIFASHNRHKGEEIAAALPIGFKLNTLADMGFTDEIAETGSTLAENATIKAQTIYDCFGKPCFADDTGLEVAALDGAPGVYSARFAGENATFRDNCELLLQKLKGQANRTAAFTTVFCFIDRDGAKYLFEGSVAGSITEDFMGDQGFGYDPIFMPEGQALTFAQMSLEQKNRLSHRAIALAKLVDFLKATYSTA